MDLRAWRKSKKLTLMQAAPILGLAVSTLSDLECCATVAIPFETMARILGATAGAVTAADLFSSWHRAHSPGSSSEHRAAGRSAMHAFQKAAKTRK